MTAVLIEGGQSITAGMLLLYLLYAGFRKGMFREGGWVLMSAGMALVLAGSMTDVLRTGVSEQLSENKTVSGQGNTAVIVCYALGLPSLVIGFGWWARKMVGLRQSYVDLQGAHYFLDAKIREHTKELKEAQERLVQSAQLASLGQMSAGLAHEINQPLGTIQLNTELTQRMLGSEETIDRGAISKLQGESQAQCGRIIRIIRHLRAFSRDGESAPRDNQDLNAMIAESFDCFPMSCE